MGRIRNSILILLVMFVSNITNARPLKFLCVDANFPIGVETKICSKDLCVERNANKHCVKTICLRHFVILKVDDYFCTMKETRQFTEEELRF